MSQIRCPHCGEVFQVDESGYADIARQVRDQEFQHDLAELRLALLDGVLDLTSQLVCKLAHDRALLGAQGAHLAQDRRELALFAEIADTLRLERFHVGGLGDRADRRLAQALHQFFHGRFSLL